MKRRIVYLLALSFILSGLAYVSVAHNPAAPPVGAFTLRKSIVIYHPDGTQEQRRQIYRRASDGSFRIIDTDGNVIFMDRGFMQGRGFYHVDYKTKTLWRDTTQTPNRVLMPADPAPLMKSEFYVGTDILLGRTAYHHRVPGNREGTIDRDVWFFAETGGVPVKEIYYRADGRIERSSEPYSLEFEEPDPTLIRLPDFKEADAALPQ